jgi:mannose-6-phosphate isomerase-like protein (cupin superfamily)
MIKKVLASNIFKLQQSTKNKKNFKIDEYNSSHSTLSIIKFEFFKDQKVNYLINNKTKTEFIFIVISGSLTLNLKENVFYLNSYDSINFFSSSLELNINGKKNTTALLISIKSVKNINNLGLKFFNFKKNIKIQDLWGGKCISRPYEGQFMTLVLFDLKKNFKFLDKGHFNEQITFLISGRMNFYVNKKKFILYKNCGVDIAPNQLHGGTSRGAVGFDIFYPKRVESNYKNDFIF